MTRISNKSDRNRENIRRFEKLFGLPSAVFFDSDSGVRTGGGGGGLGVETPPLMTEKK